MLVIKPASTTNVQRATLYVLLVNVTVKQIELLLKDQARDLERMDSSLSIQMQWLVIKRDI